MAERIFIPGHRGMVGSALCREYARRGIADILTAGRDQLDLTRQQDVYDFLRAEKPDAVIVAAARVGGIHANATFPADFIRDNLSIALNLIEGSRLAGIPRLLFLGSSCIYPRLAPQPMPEDCLLTGPLEPTNEAYVIAKIAGLKLCQHYRTQYGLTYHSAMPTNLYGPGDNYDAENSHVIPGLIRRFHAAKESGADKVTIWGTGNPRREFLHVEDLARACCHLLAQDNPPDWVNVGTGEDISILELATEIATTVGFTGEILKDPTKPDGTPRKLLDVHHIASTGWRPIMPLQDGLKSIYEEFCQALRDGSARIRYATCVKLL